MVINACTICQNYNSLVSLIHSFLILDTMKMQPPNSAEPETPSQLDGEQFHDCVEEPTPSQDHDHDSNSGAVVMKINEKNCQVVRRLGKERRMEMILASW